MFNIVTVAREYGSGGGLIARSIADKLGWTLLDQEFLTAVRRVASIDAETVLRYDENVDPWWRRFHYDGLRAAAIVGGLRPDQALFGAEAMVKVAQRVILDAARTGRCVIVGRGAQCVLRGREEAFHVFIYAPWDERVFRSYSRAHSNQNVERLIRDADKQRAGYIERYYGRDWTDPHLYQMMINSQIGVETAAGTIVNAVRDARAPRVACIGQPASAVPIR